MAFFVALLGFVVVNGATVAPVPECDGDFGNCADALNEAIALVQTRSRKRGAVSLVVANLTSQTAALAAAGEPSVNASGASASAATTAPPLAQNPGVPRTLRAVLTLVFQYVLVHTLLAAATFALCLRSWDLAMERAVGVLQSCLAPIAFTPMLCALFLAAWLQGVCDSGSPEPRATSTSLPSGWMEALMTVLTVVLVTKTGLHMLAGYVAYVVARLTRGATAEAGVAVPATGPRDEDLPLSRRRGARSGTNEEGGAGGGALETVICFSVSGLMYGSILAIMVGTSVDHEGVALDSVVMCTLLLSAQYFAVTLCLQIARMCAHDGKEDEEVPVQCFALPTTSALRRVTSAISLAPASCFLFQALRLHALESTPERPGGEADDLPVLTQEWARKASLAIFGVVLLHVCTAPWVPGEEPFEKGDEASDALAARSGRRMRGRSCCFPWCWNLLSVSVSTLFFICLGFAVRASHWNDLGSVEVSSALLSAVFFFALFALQQVQSLLCCWTTCADALREGAALCPMVSALLLCARWRDLRHQALPAAVSSRLISNDLPLTWVPLADRVILLGLLARALALLISSISGPALGRQEEGKNAAAAEPTWPKVHTTARGVQFFSTLLILGCTVVIIGDPGW